MNVRVSRKLEELIDAKVASGGYRNRDEVVAQALKLLDEKDRLQALNAALDEGEADLREGRTVVVRTKAELDALIRDL